MTVESELFDTLKGLVSNRVYPNTFPQPEAGTPVYPMIRYVIIATEIDPDICGDGDADSIRVQLDLVDDDALSTFALRDSVRAIMKTHTEPAVLEDTASEFDVETKTHRVRMDYIIYLSST
jgi:hypothetical protein